MPEYRNVRLEIHVYEELRKGMLPMESMSQTIQRILNALNEIRGHAEAIVEAHPGYSQGTKGVR